MPTTSTSIEINKVLPAIVSAAGEFNPRNSAHITAVATAARNHLNLVIPGHNITQVEVSLTPPNILKFQVTANPAIDGNALKAALK